MINGGNNVAKKSIAKKNRFAGSDAVYSTKKYLVREDVCTGKDGITRISKRYIRKSPKAYKEFRDIWG